MSNYITTKEELQQIKTAWAKAVNSKKAKKYFTPCHQYRYDVPKGSIIEGWKKMSGGRFWVSEEKLGKERNDGWVKAEHHILYNILRGKPLHTGFSPIVNPNKMNPYVSNMSTFYLCVQQLINRVEWAQELVADAKAVEKLKSENTFLTLVDKLRQYMKESDSKDELLEENTGFTGLVEKLRGHLRRKPTGLMSASSKKWTTDRLRTYLEPFDSTISVELLARLDVEQLKSITMFNHRIKDNYWLHHC